MTSDEMREAVARMIDPAGWSRNQSIAKANAILSMISASPVEEENKRLREALEPFSMAASLLDALWGDHEGQWRGDACGLSVGDLRRARALTNNISTGSPAESETSGGVG